MYINHASGFSLENTVIEKVLIKDGKVQLTICPLPQLVQMGQSEACTTVATFETFDMQFGDVVDEIQGQTLDKWDGSFTQLETILGGARIYYYEVLGNDHLYFLIVRKKRLLKPWQKVHISYSSTKVLSNNATYTTFKQAKWVTKHYCENAVDWMRPIEMQVKAVEKLSNVADEDVHQLIQPGTKSDWGEAAVALISIGYPRIEGVIGGLLCWLMDMNWPGALPVLELLKTVPSDILATHIEEQLDFIFETNDSIWLYWMFELIHFAKLMTRIEKAICIRPKEDIIKLFSEFASDAGCVHDNEVKTIVRTRIKEPNTYEDLCLNWIIGIFEYAKITQSDFDRYYKDKI